MNPNHDELGRFASGPGGVSAFHGTTEGAAKTIMQSGFSLGSGRTFGEGSLYEDARGRAVFVASKERTALWYARQRVWSKGDRGKAAVLELRIPKSEWKLFQADREHEGAGAAAFTSKKIPAKWIVGLKVYDRFGDVVRSVKKVDDDSVSFFVCVDLAEWGDIGKRAVERFDGGAVVLRLDSPELQRRWRELRDAGASWDYPDYRPHVTITYDGDGVDLDAVEPYAGPLIFGPEEFAEVAAGGFDPGDLEEEVLKSVNARMSDG